MDGWLSTNRCVMYTHTDPWNQILYLILRNVNNDHLCVFFSFFMALHIGTSQEPFTSSSSKKPFVMLPVSPIPCLRVTSPVQQRQAPSSGNIVTSPFNNLIWAAWKKERKEAGNYWIHLFLLSTWHHNYRNFQYCTKMQHNMPLCKLHLLPCWWSLIPLGFFPQASSLCNEGTGVKHEIDRWSNSFLKLLTASKYIIVAMQTGIYGPKARNVQCTHAAL